VGDEASDDNRLYLIQQYLASAAERERQLEASPEAVPQPQAGGSGASAVRGEQGATGGDKTPPNPGRAAIKGPSDNPEVRLSPAAQLEQAKTFGILELLRSSGPGDPNAPGDPLAFAAPLGSDPFSSNGGLWDAEIGEASGSNGMALTGTGLRGGGPGEGIGIDGIRTAVGMPGNGGNHIGWGHEHGRTQVAHRSRAPRLRRGEVRIDSGRLPAHIIQRVVLSNQGRFRSCYEQGLLANPSLAGRINVRFLIGRDGRVMSALNAGSDLPDPAVVHCVTRAFSSITFPAPESGVVTVQYPMQLSTD
jgi:hypothetical protein